MRIGVISFLILAAAAVFLLSGESAAQGLENYKSPYFDFRVSYPAEWSFKEISRVVTFISPKESIADDYNENISISVESLPQKAVTLEQYASTVLSDLTLKRLNNELISYGEKLIKKRPVYFVIWKNTTGLKLKRYILFSGSGVYNITYTAKEDKFDRYLPQAEQILGSLEIKEPA